MPSGHFSVQVPALSASAGASRGAERWRDSKNAAGQAPIEAFCLTVAVRAAATALSEHGRGSAKSASKVFGTESPGKARREGAFSTRGRRIRCRSRVGRWRRMPPLRHRGAERGDCARLDRLGCAHLTSVPIWLRRATSLVRCAPAERTHRNCRLDHCRLGRTAMRGGDGARSGAARSHCARARKSRQSVDFNLENSAFNPVPLIAAE